ncbi:MAG: hypothetical protein N2110_02585 [Flavobacteriales bacterium]|nr:hypothetical protein [Flavobacteriales bacterium]
MLTLWLAGRFFFHPRRMETAHWIAFASALAYFTVALAMVVTLSGFNGLRALVVQGFYGTDPDLRLQLPSEALFRPDSALLQRLLTRPEVAAVHAVLEGPAIAVHGNEFAVVKLRGLDPAYFHSGVPITLAYGAMPGGDEEVALGVRLGERLGLSPDQTNRLSLYYPGRLGRTVFGGDAFVQRSVAVSGAFILHQEANQNLVMGTLNLARELFPEKASQISYLGIYLKREVSPAVARKKIMADVGTDFEVLLREEQHKDVYKVLRLEKLAVFVVLGFIAVISSFILFGAGSLLLIEKGRSLAVLSALGMAPVQLRRICIVWMGLVALAGALPGLVTGVVLCLAQQRWAFVSLSSSDSAPPFPVEVQVKDVAVVALFLVGWALALSFVRVAGLKVGWKQYQTFKT